MPTNPANSITVNAPAKINLMLSVHGPRGDGFHYLTSLVVALAFGDTLHVAVSAESNDRLSCDQAEVPLGAENLILRAADCFRAKTGLSVFFDFHLEKRVPMGAGLGGGSSDAASALKAMNVLCAEKLSKKALLALAADLGSDCPFFMHAQPAILRGRGEEMQYLEAVDADRLRGRSIILFRPEFPVNTAWAYSELRKTGSDYESKDLANKRLAVLSENEISSHLLFNSFESAIGRKYLSIPTLLTKLRGFGVPCLMSGSGSCCFALSESKGDMTVKIRDLVQDAWGESVFWVETSII